MSRYASDAKHEELELRELRMKGIRAKSSVQIQKYRV
jgi:hypothetical protein